MERPPSLIEWQAQNRLEDCPELDAWYNEYITAWFRAAEPYLRQNTCPVCGSKLQTRVQHGRVYGEDQEVYITECSHCDFSYCD